MRFKTGLFLSFMAIATTAKADIILTWDAPESDVNGDSISPLILEYNLYAGLSGDELVLGYTTKKMEVNITNIPPGCYDFHVTAMRVDVTPGLESTPSSEVSACIDPTMPNGGQIVRGGDVEQDDGDGDLQVKIVPPNPPMFKGSTR